MTVMCPNPHGLQVQPTTPGAGTLNHPHICERCQQPFTYPVILGTAAKR